MLSCSKFLTTSGYTPRLRARLAVEQQLIDDATARGWPREVERHEGTDDACCSYSVDSETANRIDVTRLVPDGATLT